MNRWLIALVVGLMAVGCAEGVEEPMPAPEQAQRPERQAPVQTFSTDLDEASEGTTAPELPERDVVAIPPFEKPNPGE